MHSVACEQALSCMNGAEMDRGFREAHLLTVREAGKVEGERGAVGGE